jgi:tetratricopeptide (TPR) repeat protein
MQRRFKAASLVVILAGLGLSLVACGQVSRLKATKSFKEANSMYRAQDYKRAAERYEEVIMHDPTFTSAYFYLGNSYDNLYKPIRRGDAENDHFLLKAIENYRKAAELEEDPAMRKLSLEYLVAAYGPDRMDDPNEAIPIVQKMIDIDPTETDNYFILARIYEDAGEYGEAESILLKARDMRSDDPVVWTQLASFYNRQEDFERTMEAWVKRAELEPNNPEAFYTISAFYEQKVRGDFRLTPAQKSEFIDKGVEAVNRAIELNPNYFEAISYKNLLLRQQALVEKDPKRQAALIKEADELRDLAIEVRKKRAAGVGGE